MMDFKLVIIAILIGSLKPQTMAAYTATPRVEIKTTMMAQLTVIKSVAVWLQTVNSPNTDYRKIIPR